MIIIAQYFVGTPLEKIVVIKHLLVSRRKLKSQDFLGVIPEDFATAHRIAFISEQFGMLICRQCKTLCGKLEPCNDDQPRLVISHTNVKQSRCLSSDMSHCFYQFTAKQNCKEDFSLDMNRVRAICLHILKGISTKRLLLI